MFSHFFITMGVVTILQQVKAQEVLDKVRLSEEITRERLCQVASTALRTKVHSDLADKLTEVCVDAVLAIKEEGKPLDLHMVEIMDMQVCMLLQLYFSTTLE